MLCYKSSIFFPSAIKAIFIRFTKHALKRILQLSGPLQWYNAVIAEEVRAEQQKLRHLVHVVLHHARPVMQICDKVFKIPAHVLQGRRGL